jgi:hypothetical protein
MHHSRPKTLIFTNSYDTTCDLLVEKLGGENVFRLNFNLWRDYKILITGDGFEICDPTGRTITNDDVAKLYWRKPMRWRHLFPDRPEPEGIHYVEEELWYALRELVNLLWLQGKLVLVEPFADSRAGKFIQARLASRHFEVPSFKFISHNADRLVHGRTVVAKSLSSTRVKHGAVLYTTKVDEGALDPAQPWMLQDLVEAQFDVTVVYVRDRMFAFELPRSLFSDRTLDWREVATSPETSEWALHRLPKRVEESIDILMRDLGLQYGRLDFLWQEGRYVFLEVNANGEWGWLDCEGEHGLLDKIVEEVAPFTPVRPLPFRNRPVA